MSSEWDSVRGDLGDKVVDALRYAIVATREDLARYRTTLPEFATEQSGRGMASWIHDRLWQHVLRGLFDVPEVSFVDSGPTREMYVGTAYRLRFKRHDNAGLVRNYPTPTATAFWDADAFMLPGLGEMRLCFGYVWDSETDDIGDAVMSSRDGQDNVLWMVRLDDVDGGFGEAGGDITPIVPPNEPLLPRIDMPARNDEQDGTEDQ